MKYLICGFYGKDNIGDDMFESAFKYLLKEDELKFINVSEISPSKLLDFDAVIVGGGDLMNDFYGIKYKEALMEYTGYKIAVGVGFSFEECRKMEYIDYFDDIILRNKTDLRNISAVIGSKHVNYMPDLGFSLPLNFTPQIKTGRKVGLFLISSLIANPILTSSMIQYIHWLIENNYTVELIPMYTNPESKDNDLIINKHIYESFKHTQLVTLCDVLTLEEFYNKLEFLDYAVCMRFHSLVFCTRAGIPFISICLTRKAEIYSKELASSVRFNVEITREVNYEVKDFNLEEAKSKFIQLTQSRDNISRNLLMIDKTNNSIFRSNKFQNILHNANKRRISRPVNPTSQQDYIYDKYFNKFLLHGINPYTDQCLDLMDRTTLNQISDQLCYDITQDSSNDYIEGTRINLEFKLHKLRDIIAYICWDYENKNTPPKLNLSYIRQDSFKGLHRAGWQYCIEPLYCLSSDYGIFLDTYIDKTFGWSSNILQKVGILPYTNYWIGFVHHTFNTSFSDNNCTHVFSSQLFLDSLPLCKGLFCLTEYLSQQVREKLYQLGFNIKVNTLMHPTVFPPLNFSMNKYLNNKDKLLINVGSWYRNPVSIHLIPPITNIKFATLRGKKMESNFPPTDMIVMMEEDNLICYNNIWSEFFMEYLNEHKDNYSLILYNKIRNYLKENSQINIRDFEGEDYLQPFIDKVQVIQTLPDDGFDVLLSENIVFLNLVDASVANTVIECIVRNTPILANRIVPLVELLGPNYPFFYDNLADIPSLLNNNKILQVYNYLRQLDKEKYRLDYFIRSFVNSEIYKSL